MTEIEFHEGFFFFQECWFDGEVLKFSFGDSSERYQIEFRFVRAFLTYKESDGYDKVKKYETRLVFGDSKSQTGVYKIMKGSILESTLGARLSAEKPAYYWVSTPDECFEVITFQEPSITNRSSGLRP